MTTEARRTHPWLWPLVADLVCVLALAIGGKSSHDPDGPALAVLGIAWPFAVAAVLAHAVLVRGGRRTRRVWPEGVSVFVAAYVLGMLLRAASGRGLDPAFLLVAATFLAVTMLGWRAVVHLAARPRA